MQADHRHPDGRFNEPEEDKDELLPEFEPMKVGEAFLLFGSRMSGNKRVQRDEIGDGVRQQVTKLSERAS